MMNEIIKLISVTSTTDADGFKLNTETSVEVMCETKSVGRSEFYSATQNGIDVSLVAVVNYDDFKLLPSTVPTLVQYDGERYRVIRTYRVKQNDTIELTLGAVDG